MKQSGGIQSISLNTSGGVPLDGSRHSRILQARHSLENMTAQLENLVEQLEGRLASILTPELSTPKLSTPSLETISKKATEGSQLASELELINSNLSFLVGRLQTVLANLEL